MSFRSRIVKLQPRGKFGRSVSVLAGGTLAARMIGIAAAPLLTRLYSPDDFGLLAIYSAMLAITGVVAGLRFPFAIPLPQSDREAARIAVLSLLIVVASVAMTVLVVVVFGNAIASLLNVPRLAPYIWLVPVGVALVGVYQVFNYWAIRTKNFGAIARTTLLQGVSMVAVQVGGFALGPLALLVGQAIGQGAGAASLGWQSVKGHISDFRQIRILDLRCIAVRYRRFPLYSTWGAMSNTLGVYLPSLLLASLFNPTAAGFYALTHRVLSMPMQLAGRAIADVFFSQAAEKNRMGEVAPLVAKMHKVLTHLAMPFTLLFVIGGPDIFALVFGEEWRIAGTFARWMSPWLYLVFVASPLSSLFAVLEKQAQGMVFQVGLLIVRASTLFLGAWIGDVDLAIILFSAGSAFCWLLFLGWAFHISGNPWVSLIRPTFHSFVWAIALVSPAAVMLYVGSDLNVVIGLFFSATIIALRYVVFLRRVW